MVTVDGSGHADASSLVRHHHKLAFAVTEHRINVQLLGAAFLVVG
jgi:hypothetical protein